MTEWILIFYVIHWGEAITSNSVRFSTELACQEAVGKLEPRRLSSYTSGQIYVNAFCIEDLAAKK